ncbi:hypothetical protein D3C85_1485270 [compost metagenome]
MPIPAIKKKSPTASCIEKVPLITATNANLNTISEEASFTRLSHSKIVSILLGTFIPLSTVAAATASGGEIIPPNKNPSAKVNPGIKDEEV